MNRTIVRCIVPALALLLVGGCTFGRTSVPYQQHAVADAGTVVQHRLYKLKEFDFKQTLGAADYESKFGPPSAHAGHLPTWWVYRLKGDQELWLLFDQTNLKTLRAADVVRNAEVGYSRRRVFEAARWAIVKKPGGAMIAA